MAKKEIVRTKKDIVRQISERADLPQVKTKQIVQWTFDAIVEILVQEGRIELRNFGVFEVKTRRPRKARNPKTEQAVDVPAKNVVTFQSGKKMEARVGELPKVYLPKPKPLKVPEPAPMTKKRKGKSVKESKRSTADKVPTPVVPENDGLLVGATHEQSREGTEQAE